MKNEDAIQPVPVRTSCLLPSAFCLCASVILSTAVELDLSKLPPAATNQVNYFTDIKPIFEQSCFRCHGPERPKSGFRLDNRESALKGGHQGEDIVPGNSGKSPLIHYVARLDPDMAMPPEDKGDPLTREQVALLRAWIDQGAAWGETETARVTFSIAPALGYAWVNGNEAKFREHWWMRDGHRAGVEWFELTEQYSPDAKLTVSGRAMTDDYLAELLLEKKQLGFANFGFEQFRKYDSDTGGYYPPFSQPIFSLDENLHLDIGRAWFDFGLTLPEWPRMVLGYEYQYRQGEKSTLPWGPVTEGAETRNIFPARKEIDEHTHVLKFDLDFERGGWLVEDDFRGEWTESKTSRYNVNSYDLATSSLIPDTVHEGWKSFQGANTFRVERSFRDWIYASGGYLYSHLSGDADISRNPGDASAGPLYPRIEWLSQDIVLERETHVGNLNVLLGPWQGGTLTLGAQAEWSKQNGTMEGEEDYFLVPPYAVPLFSGTNNAITDIDRTVVDEILALRIARLPFTTLFAEGRFQQESIGHYENSVNFDPAQSFVRDTDAQSDAFDVKAGFDTSPRSWLKLGAHYHWRDKSTTYDDGYANNGTDPINGYPTFIEARDLTTQEVVSKLTLRPQNWVTTTFSYRLVATDYHTETESATSAFDPAIIASPGGRILAGNYDAQIFSLNLSLTPWRRLHWFTTVSYQDVRSTSLHEYSSAVVPYRGDIWSVLCHARYVLTKKTDLTAGYTFSRADFGQDNYADGLPVGMRYDLHGLQAGVISKCTKNLTTRLQYGFYHYDEPTSGGANDYTAHSIFASLSLRFD
jgi:mono/diheme cytochrome c family protein